MGYCGYPHCTDPNCIGTSQSGIYPAVIELRDKRGNTHSYDVTRGDYRDLEQERRKSGKSTNLTKAMKTKIKKEKGLEDID